MITTASAPRHNRNVHGVHGASFTEEFWTAADQAELDVLIWELVGASFAHRDCEACRALPPGLPCPPLNDALEAVLDWRRGRLLLSRAAKARRRELATRLRVIQADLAQLKAAA